MDATNLSHLLPGWQDRRETIAEHWYSAITGTGFTPLDEADVRRRLITLVERVIALLLAESFERHRAQAVGVELVKLGYLHHRALGQTQAVLSAQFTQGLCAVQIAALQPRLIAVLSELAAGFYRQARATIVAEQAELQAALLIARDEAEAALCVREEHLRTILTNAPIILFTTDQAGVIMFVDGASLQALEFPPGKMIGQSVFDIARRLPQADVSLISEHFHRALAGEAFNVIGTMAGLFFETRYAPLRNEQDEITGVIGVALDITERRRVEAELAVARRRLAESEKPKLTDDELTILQRMAAGKPYRDIGNELGMSSRTVRRHVKAMYKRLGAENRTQLVLRAIQLELLKN